MKTAEEFIQECRDKSIVDFMRASDRQLLVDAFKYYARIQIEKDRERVIKQLTTLPGSGASQYIISTVPITLD